VPVADFALHLLRKSFEQFADAEEHDHRKRNANDGEETAEDLTSVGLWSHVAITLKYRKKPSEKSVLALCHLSPF